MDQDQNPSKKLEYPLNPNFGNGTFYRRLRLQKGEDSSGSFVLGEVEDCNHGFISKVYYRDNIVTNIQAEDRRTPFDTCNGAFARLQELIGSPLGQSVKEQLQQLNPSRHCTHWLDLTLLCMQQACRDEAMRDYLVDIPDEKPGQATTATIRLNGDIVHSWQVKDWQVLAPKELAENTLYKGFARWANNMFGDDETALEAAYILQKGYFVSGARPMDLNKLAGEPAKQHAIMLGACYTYSEPVVSEARRTANSVRDFSNCEEQLLKFS